MRHLLRTHRVVGSEPVSVHLWQDRNILGVSVTTAGRGEETVYFSKTAFGNAARKFTELCHEVPAGMVLTEYQRGTVWNTRRNR